jgi:hypothetical protein
MTFVGTLLFLLEGPEIVQKFVLTRLFWTIDF